MMSNIEDGGENPKSTETKNATPAEADPGLVDGKGVMKPPRQPQAPTHSASPALTESNDLSHKDLSSLIWWNVPPETFEAWRRINGALAADSSGLSLGPG
jgi:hypothetical protein